MKQRTLILCDLVDAANALAAMQASLTKAHVALCGRSGPAARDALLQVTEARAAVYADDLGALLETAITLTGRMP